MSDFFISAAELSHTIARGEPLRIFDVRRAKAIETSSRFVPGARWRDHLDTFSWASQLSREQLVVLNCMHGHNVSQIATAQLRSAGYMARVLAGGIAAWIDNGHPTTSQSKLAPVDAKPTTWVSPIKPEIDQIACSWLVTRFVDPDAIFHFVEPDWVNEIATELGGVSFGVAGASIAPENLDTLLREFGLEDPALESIARLVRSAAGHRTDFAPEAAGLRAVMLGNAIIGKTDHDIMRLGFPVYDALYARIKLVTNEQYGREPMTT